MKLERLTSSKTYNTSTLKIAKIERIILKRYMKMETKFRNKRINS